MINLAPKASALSLEEELAIGHSRGNINPTTGTTMNNNNGSSSSSSGIGTMMSPPPSHRSQRPSGSSGTYQDGLTGISSGNISASSSFASTSAGTNANGGATITATSSSLSDPGGSADTRRRITKLSKAREREKAPRLVEYFCVVSSVAIQSKSKRGGSSSSSSSSSSSTTTGPTVVSSPMRKRSVTSVLPRTPGDGIRATSSAASSSSSSDSVGDGSRCELDGSEFAPQITARYPLSDHEDNPLLEESITAFCFPSGKIPIIRSDGSNGGDSNSMPKVHYFVTTGESGQKMYGTCLTVWEGHEVTLEQHNRGSVKSPRRPSTRTNTQTNAQTDTTRFLAYLPKCLVILSMHPYLVAFREYLTQIHRQSKMAPPTATNATNAATGVSTTEVPMEVGTIVTIPTASATILKTTLSLPIERYITNFCSELPAPPPGSFQVQTTVLDSVISIWSPPHNMPIAWVSLPFSHLFQCLDVENVLKVWTALALERQVLVTSTQLSLLTTCCEILLSLLFPMKWSHAYIPVLPHFLVPILSAPMPFLCGIDKRHLASTMEDLAEECIVVDLDKNMVSMGVNTAPVPRLPKYVYQRLRNKVERHAGHVHREVRSLRSTDDTSEMGIHLPPDVKSMADAMWESRLCLFDEAFMLTFTPEERRKNWLNGDDAGSNDPKANLLMTLGEKRNLRGQSHWDAVQEAFLETYCFLLQKYRRFLVFPSKQNEGAYGGAGFRSREFLAHQRADARDFSEELAGSQMFDDFVTKRLYGSGEADIRFFDAAVDRYARRNGPLAGVRGLVRENNGNGAKHGDHHRGSGAAAKKNGGMGLRNMFGRSKLGSGGATHGANSDDGEDGTPLLQSARVKRELKTIVPPEPSQADLPTEEGVENAVVVHVTAKGREETTTTSATTTPVHANDDDDTVTSMTSAGTTASKLEGGRVYYHYPTFPERLDPQLFGTPRPMSSAVRAEYDRQRERVGKFRRTTGTEQEAAETEKITRSNAISGQAGPVEKPATAEVTSFTVFFMTFTAVVGKDLMAVDSDSLDRLDSKSIVSTYAGHRSSSSDMDEESRHIANLVDEIVMDADLPQTPTKKERPRPKPKKSPVRHRFNEKLSTLKIMEAKETSKAELVIAFEMLRMMKERGLKADPEAYQCLIDACGRCGDTDRATQLLSRMHEDGIVADGVVYSSLVSAFSAENAWKQASGEVREELPDWANGASIDMDWNTLKVQRRSYIDIVREKLGAVDENGDHPAGLRDTFKRIVSRNKASQAEKKEVNNANYTEQYVTDQVLRQILLGENLLEVVYPDISIDTDNEFCPRCNYYLSDDDVVAGWSAGNSQEYKTECPNCLTKFVPHFCVQSTLPSFVGSRGPSSALFCERLSPWVLKKELRSVISGGIEDLLSPEWRERESKNAVLWWNLILSFMRYRFPFTFLLQGSFSSSLIAPTPDDEENLDATI